MQGQSTGLIRETPPGPRTAAKVAGVEALFTQGTFKVGNSVGGKLTRNTSKDYVVYVSFPKSNTGNRKAFNEWALNTHLTKSRDIKFKARATSDRKSGVNPEFDVVFGIIHKPFGGANLGDVAEGLLACALASRFIKKRGKVVLDDVWDMIIELNKKGLASSKTSEGCPENLVMSGFNARQLRKGLEVRYITQSNNKGIKMKDDVVLYIGLAKVNMEYLLSAATNYTTRSVLEGFAKGSIAYANSQRVMDWAELIYTNKMYDLIECKAVGLAGSQTVTRDEGTKIDVEVFITDDAGEPRLIETGSLSRGVDIKISLKAGAVQQFGQKGGVEWEGKRGKIGYAEFFQDLFGLDRSTLSQYKGGFDKKANAPKVPPNKRISDSVCGLYKSVAAKLEKDINHIGSKRNPNANIVPFFRALADGIIQYATLDEEYVHLVQLMAETTTNPALARTYEFEKLRDLWTPQINGKVNANFVYPNYVVSYETSSSKVAGWKVGGKKVDGPLPKIIISERGKDGADSVLLQLRVKAETVNGKPYYRNYIEKGHAMTRLIGSHVDRY
jgi:hypothetical protein